MSSFDEILFHTEERMEKALGHLREEFASVRSGKASPELVANVPVEAYGSSMRLRELAAITVPDAHLLLIQPWDPTVVDAVRKALEEARLGINPMVDGKMIRLPIPPLSEERRHELIRVVRKLAEEGRVALRGVRRHGLEEAKALQKESDVSEDDLARAEKEVQKLTDRFIAEVDRLLQAKEAELLKV
ncbi:Ribosome-recycling factor [Methylacidimicrobium cyclopophantes]|uniref:Ribosome-recycling factor n=1 Tax=Methylacidimicrobium cyclopophantes TaxID=1041766 RepID=A0A5E6MH42_9BACT|nr:ribosome recycling factor [Methylacidimicrobium cyclopophantes]VVM04795.1 Ribosome-recycling factor [Methylacidimicrobium cyclopophantes]